MHSCVRLLALVNYPLREGDVLTLRDKAVDNSAIPNPIPEPQPKFTDHYSLHT